MVDLDGGYVDIVGPAKPLLERSKKKGRELWRMNLLTRLMANHEKIIRRPSSSTRSDNTYPSIHIVCRFVLPGKRERCMGHRLHRCNCVGNNENIQKAQNKA